MHISDLHRSPGDPISNTELIESLLADREVHQLNNIPRPDAVIVSGDLIWGATLGAPDYRENIRQQYAVAINFLVELTERFLNGDRSRVVITPGNHDCCWNTAKSAMKLVARDQEPEDIGAQLRDRQAHLRWSWKDRRLYKIIDMETYRQRLDAYWDCVEDFYGQADLRIPLCRSRGFNVFELDDGKIAVVSFESQHENDHLSDQAYIPSDSISRCATFLRDRQFRGRLKVAVWHHGIAGPPMASDYLNVKSVLEMAGVGFRIGLHGHQHYADTSTQYIHLPETEAMAIVGAGSLCAGERDLPHSVNRQYNIVVIGDDYSRAHIYVREIVVANRFGASRDPRFVPDGRFTVRWDPVTDIVGRAIDHDATEQRSAVLTAEQALKGGSPSSAADLLYALDLSNDPYARNLFVDATRAAGRFDDLVQILDPPKNVSELVELVQAHKEMGDIEAGLRDLERYQANFPLAQHVVDDLRQTLRFQLSLGGAQK